MQSKRVMGIEPTLSAWKAEVLPLNYTRISNILKMEGAGFEPAKAKPADLQSALVDRLSTPPKISDSLCSSTTALST